MPVSLSCGAGIGIVPRPTCLFHLAVGLVFFLVHVTCRVERR